MEDLFVVIILVLVVAAFFFVRSPSVKGAIGESRVNARLGSQLNAQEYQVLKDLTLRTGGGTTQVDHVVVSRYGVFVIETKNMKGWIFGTADQARWTQTLHRHKSQFQNPIRQNYKHVKAVQEHLGIEMSQIHNVVAFVGDAEPRTPMPGNVLWSERRLTDYISAKRHVMFSGNEVVAMANRLQESALESSRTTRREHIRHVKDRAAARTFNSTQCPRCGSDMKERTNRKTGEKFLGCSRYPKCKGTRKIA